MAATTTSPNVHRRIASSAGIVMATAMIGQALGFLREWTLAHQVGSNRTTDAYYAAFTLPNMLNYLVAGGALSVIFIPVFTKYVAEDREEEGWHVFSVVVTFMTLLMLFVVVLGELLANQLVRLIAPGFPPAQKAEVVFLTRLLMPAQFGFMLGSILAAVQYVKDRFLIPSLGQALYNLGVVLGGWVLAPHMGITGFAIGAVAGALGGNLLVQLYGARQVQAQFRPSLDLRNPGFRLFLKMAVPIMLALSLTTTDDWIIRWFGSYLQVASITWLSYAKALMRVPIVAIGQAVGVAAFPVLARLYSENKFDEVNRTFNNVLKGQLLVAVPIAALTIAQAVPLVHLVFLHTRLHEPDLQATASALALFSLGMFVWASQALLSRSFYAMRNSWTPAVVGTAVTLVSLPLYSYLVHRFQYRGLAMASACGITLYVLTLIVVLAHRTHNRGAFAIIPFFFKIVGISAVGAVSSYRLTQWLGVKIGWHSTVRAFTVVALGTVAGVLLIACLAKLMKLREFERFVKTLRHRRSVRTTALEPLKSKDSTPSI